MPGIYTRTHCHAIFITGAGEMPHKLHNKRLCNCFEALIGLEKLSGNLLRGGFWVQQALQS